MNLKSNPQTRNQSRKNEFATFLNTWSNNAKRIKLQIRKNKDFLLILFHILEFP